MSADDMKPGPVLFGACPTCGTITLPPTEIAESRPFIGIPIPTSDEVDEDPRYEDLLLLEPRSMYDHCIVGVVRRFNDRFVLYDQRCILDTLEQEFTNDKASNDPSTDAIEWFEYNMAGAFVGEHTPGFLESDDE